MEPTIQIEIYEKKLASPSQRWRWRARRIGNWERMANGGEGYADLNDLIYALMTLWPRGEHIVVKFPDGTTMPLDEVEERL